MKRIRTTGLAALVSFGLLACGGGEEAVETGAEPAVEEAAAEAPAEAMGELMMPDWMTVDASASTATIELVAGMTDANNSWNFNGYYGGNAAIVVPAGYTVTVNFSNRDPVNPHSVGIDADTSGTWPAMFQDPQAVFEGAMSSNPTSMAEATLPGASETLTFVADAAGEYTMVCYIPAHAATGMWIYLRVSAEGDAGVMEM
jgi:sulfocyanin